MNRSNLTLQQIDLISLLGHTVALRYKDNELILVGRLHTHKDEIKNGKRVEKTLVYFSVTNNDGQQWVFRHDEVAELDNQSYEIWLNW